MAGDPYASSRGLRAIALLGIGAFAAVYVAWTAQHWGGLLATRTFVNLSSTVAALGAGALALVRARHLPGERRHAWALLGLACLSWGGGNVVWTYLELWAQRHVPIAERVIPFPSPADVGYMLLLVFAVSALLVMVIGSTQATTRLRTFLDGLLISSAVLFAAWVVVLRPIADFAGGQEGLGPFLALAYPFGDLLLLSLLVLVASRVHPAVRPTLGWLGAAILALTVADIGFWYSISRGTYVTGAWTDAGWSLGFLLIAYAAIRPIPEVPQHEAPRPGLALSALPLAPFVVSTGLAMVVQVREGALPPFLFWNAIVVVGTLAVRQFVMVTENLQLRRQAEDALERAHEAHRMRTRLLHNITHDLQNPLSPIQIQLKLLQGKAASAMPPEDLRRRLDLVGRNVEQIKRLVADLSDVSKLQDGRLALVRSPFDLAATVRDVGDSFRPLAAAREIAFATEAHGVLPVDGDPIRLRQVLANLVSNAIKFTPPAGRITQDARVEGDLVVVEVTDTGRGLSPEEAARLFLPFSQVHRPEESPERGTGLGLFISRGLAETHGGRLTVSSRGLGKGSTFRLELPTTRAELLDADGAPVSP